MLVAPGFCPFCLGDDDKRLDDWFQQWMTKAILLNHIDKHLSALCTSKIVLCPHPCCQRKEYKDTVTICRHFFDVYSIEELRLNCVSRKRKWQSEVELEPESQPGQIHFVGLGIQTSPPLENHYDKDILADSEEMDIFDMENLMEKFTALDEN